MSHQIFLSHSGAQKGFAKDLYKGLKEKHYSVFFDIEHHSLPPGEKFPPLILLAARRCKVAVLVLSEEFVCSKWPMSELCTFIDARVTLLPLFYTLTPADLKNEDNLKRWGVRWRELAEKSSHVDVSKYREALQLLRSINGLIFTAGCSLLEFLDKVMAAIRHICLPEVMLSDRHVYGKDRLCKIILDKFEDMELRHERPSTSSSTDLNYEPVCVLGMYGLPGSGKSTLCKLLHDHFVSIYQGRVLYMQLPSFTSHDAALIEEFKKLLDLTHFRKRYDVSDLSQVYKLLGDYKLSSLTVFLVVDNIVGERSVVEAVRRVLELGVGPGSKVLLVARSLDVLTPLLNVLNRRSSYICDSMEVPSISTEEATQILLRSSEQGFAREERFAHEDSEEWSAYEDRLQQMVEDLSPNIKAIVVGVVRSCGYYLENDSQLYLPLVMEIVGARLTFEYQSDVEKWGEQLTNFWIRVKLYKLDAVRELVKQSFKSLPEQLQLLFLDVALFILPLQMESKYKYWDLQEACVLLGCMHEISCAELHVKTMMEKLQRNGFLRIFSGANSNRSYISVHDVFVEFAKSMADYSSTLLGFKCRWMNCGAEIIGRPRNKSIVLEQDTGAQVRAIILKDVDESVKRIDLKGFSRLKAVVVSECKSLSELWMVGLRSLVSVDILYSSSIVIDSTDNSLQNVERYNLKVAEQENVQNAHDVPQNNSWLPKVVRRIMPSSQQQFSFNSVPTAFKMTNLRVVTLENTGIRRLVDMSSCWPKLEELKVIENCLEDFEIGSLHNLRRFYFSDLEKGLDPFEPGNFGKLTGFCSSTPDSASKKKRILKAPVDLLSRCSVLEETYMFSAGLQGGLGRLPCKLKFLCLGTFYNAKNLSELASMAQSIEDFQVSYCENLERVGFVPHCFDSLTKLKIDYCEKLIEVTGFRHLPNLCSLIVECCVNLRALIDLDNMRMLQSIKIHDNGNTLDDVSGLSGLVKLEELMVGEGGQKVSALAVANVQNLTKLKHLCLPLTCGSAESFSLRKLVHLETLKLHSVDHAKSILAGMENLVRLKEFSLWGGREARNHLADDQSTGPAFFNFSLFLGLPPAAVSLHSIRTLKMGYLSALTSLNGIEFLLPLEKLELKRLPNLMSASELECLRSLKFLHLQDCPKLEEVPCPQAVVNLFIYDFAKLKAVKGLDSLIHLKELCLFDCPVLEELPSLCALVKMGSFRIAYCQKLKALKGCEAMKGLQSASFSECRSLECFPLEYSQIEKMRELEMTGCGFTSNLEKMVAWAVHEKQAPRLLRQASLESLQWEYYTNRRGNKEEKKRLIEVVFPSLLQILLPNDVDTCDLHEQSFLKLWDPQWFGIEEAAQDETISHKARRPAVVDELMCEMRGVAKEVLLQRFQSESFKLLILRFLDELSSVTLIPWFLELR